MSLSDDNNLHHLSVRRHSESEHIDPFSKAEDYYGDPSPALRKDAKQRTFSAKLEFNPIRDEVIPRRRLSQDATGQKPRRFLISVDETLRELLAAEDSDRNFQITVEDQGPKV